jgi:Spy/CpxP family protein refolding chaperone
VKKAKLLLILSLVLTFAAGLALGCLLERGSGGRHRRGRRDSWLVRQLDLTPEQAQQIHAIWSEAMQMGASRRERRRTLREEREKSVRDLLSEEQKAQYDRALAEYDRKTVALQDEASEAFEQTVARTKEMLTPEQREKYEQMLGRMREHGRRGRAGPGMGPPGRRPRPEPSKAGP